jgi:hypothetical protein
VEFPNQELVANPKHQLGTFTTPGASKPASFSEEYRE